MEEVEGEEEEEEDRTAQTLARIKCTPPLPEVVAAAPDRRIVRIEAIAAGLGILVLLTLTIREAKL